MSIFRVGPPSDPTASPPPSAAAPPQQPTTHEQEVIDIIDAPEPRKKARFDPSVATPGNPKNKSPLNSAIDHVEVQIESLHEGLATLLLSRSKEHLALAHRIFAKQRNIKRIEADDSYIPVSARVKFRLQAADDAAEMPEYKALQDRVAEIVTTQQQVLKKAVIECAKLEEIAAQRALDRHYCESIHSVVSLFHLVHSTPENSVCNTIAKLMEHSSECLLKHSPLTSTLFMDLYKNTISIPTFQATDIDAGHCATIVRALESVFVNSWSRYLRQVKENELSLSLKNEQRNPCLKVKQKPLPCLSMTNCLLIASNLPH